MGLSGGYQSGRINSSHSIIQEFARSDWMGLSGSDQTCQNNFPTCQNAHLFAPTKIFSAHPEIISAPPILGSYFDKLGSSTPHGIWLQRYWKPNWHSWQLGNLTTHAWLSSQTESRNFSTLLTQRMFFRFLSPSDTRNLVRERRIRASWSKSSWWPLQRL